MSLGEWWLGITAVGVELSSGSQQSLETTLGMSHKSVWSHTCMNPQTCHSKSLCDPFPLCLLIQSLPRDREAGLTGDQAEPMCSATVRITSQSFRLASVDPRPLRAPLLLASPPRPVLHFARLSSQRQGHGELALF
jgi:hypothetical protein